MELNREQHQTIRNYRRMGIDMELVEEDRVIIRQMQLFNGHILNQKQLVEMAEVIFPDKMIVPVVFSLEVADINKEWVQRKMKELGIKRKDLIKQLAIDKSSLSLYLSGKRGMDKSQKAAFFYYFLVFEINRDSREVIDEGRSS